MVWFFTHALWILHSAWCALALIIFSSPQTYGRCSVVSMRHLETPGRGPLPQMSCKMGSTAGAAVFVNAFSACAAWRPSCISRGELDEAGRLSWAEERWPFWRTLFFQCLRPGFFGFPSTVARDSSLRVNFWISKLCKLHQMNATWHGPNTSATSLGPLIPETVPNNSSEICDPKSARLKMIW